MILQCFECRARFLVPDQAVGVDGRWVRCGRCRHSWFQPPSPEMVEANLPGLEEMLESIDVKPRPIPRGSNLPVRSPPPVTPAQKATLAVLALAALAVAALFTAPWIFGLPESRGLALADVGIARIAEDKDSDKESNKDRPAAYQISGKIVNTTSAVAALPTLRVTLVDDEGNLLQYWDFSGDKLKIAPGTNVPFSTSDLEMRFSKGTRFVVELGNSLELALRRKPG